MRKLMDEKVDIFYMVDGMMDWSESWLMRKLMDEKVKDEKS